jgi:hypothetical protein
MDTTEPDLPSPRFDGGNLLPFTEEEVDRIVRVLAEHYAPRRFALCQIDRDPVGQARDVRVIAWGMRVGSENDEDEDGDERVVVSRCANDEGRTISGSFSSAERARFVFGRGIDLRVGWADPA